MTNAYSIIFSKKYFVNNNNKQKYDAEKNNGINELSKLLGYPEWIRDYEKNNFLPNKNCVFKKIF